MKNKNFKVKGICGIEGKKTSNNNIYPLKEYKKMKLPKKVPVTIDFDENKIVDEATIFLKGKNLMFEAKVDDLTEFRGKIAPKFIVEKVEQKDGINIIKGMRLDSVSLCAFHSQDKEIEPYSVVDMRKK